MGTVHKIRLRWDFFSQKRENLLCCLCTICFKFSWPNEPFFSQRVRLARQPRNREKGLLQTEKVIAPSRCLSVAPKWGHRATRTIYQSVKERECKTLFELPENEYSTNYPGRKHEKASRIYISIWFCLGSGLQCRLSDNKICLHIYRTKHRSFLVRWEQVMLRGKWNQLKSRWKNAESLSLP